MDVECEEGGGNCYWGEKSLSSLSLRLALALSSSFLSLSSSSLLIMGLL